MPTTQSFGMVPIGMKSAFSFDVTNMGGADAGKIAFSLEGINISEFSAVPDASCNDPLKANFTCSITVTFSPTLVGAKTASLRVTASPGGFAKADLTASAVPASMLGTISLMPSTPDPFGSVAVGDSSSGFFLLKNDGTTDIGKIAPTISGSSNEFTLTDNSCPDTLPAGAVCALTVKFSPLVIGRRTANLQVFAPPGAFATAPLSGLGTSGAQLRISPSSRSFGSRQVNSTSTFPTPQTFTVTNAGPTTGPLTVVVEGPDMADFQIVQNFCQNVTLVQGQAGCTISVRFNPITTRGAKIADIGVSATPGGVVRATITGNAL
jgi:hypothetical protein